ncbi:unnamed protein product [Nezara viridula]|uniref:Uncharacterized protein n=1 Tax=Nezara viridula TaxID=85310 RepID=A0A9P0MST8_NEZVI|nr:unnamed protein product [Nezara viridula]
MKLSNEGAVYIVIYISLSFHETSCLYDESDDYFDSDLIPFLSISTEKAPRSIINDSFKSCQTTLETNIQNHYDTVTAIPTRQNSTPNIARNVLQSESNNPLTALYKVLQENITADSKPNQGTESGNTLKNENNEFLRKKVNKQFSKYTTCNSKRMEKIDVLSKTKSEESGKDDFNEYIFSNFFDSLLSMVSYINPNLLNVLDANIKKFQMYNVIKRDSINSISSDDSDESCSTLKTMLCNCDYCRTGKPDTVLYIVSGKKLNNSITYHKLTSINRSKPKTSYRYQLRTTDDNGSNCSYQLIHLPANYKELSMGAKTNKKIVNSNQKTSAFHTQPSMKTAPVSRNLDIKDISPYKGLKNFKGLYKTSNAKVSGSVKVPLKLIEPRSHKYKPIFFFENNPFIKETDSKIKNENHDETDNNKNRIEPLHFFYQSTTKSIEFSDYYDRNKSDVNKKQESLFCDEAKNPSTFRNLNRSSNVTKISKISMNTSEKIPETNSNRSPVKNIREKNVSNEKIDAQEPNLSRIENVEFLTTEANIITFHPGSSKGITEDNYLKNAFHKKNFKKISKAALNDKTLKFLSPLTRAFFEIHPVINKNDKYTPKYSTEPLEKSLIGIIDKLLDKVEALNVTGAEYIETTTDSTIQISNGGNNISNTDDFRNSSLGTKPDKNEYSTDISEQLNLCDSMFSATSSTVQPSAITAIVTATVALNTSVNKIENYVNYDLYLRNLIGESNIDDKIMCS